MEEKEKKGMPKWAIVLIVIFAIGIIGSALSDDEIKSNSNKSTGNNNVEEKSETVNKEEECYITIEEFNQINNGMSYNEVKNIVGCEGTVNSDTQVGDYRLIMYSWYGKDKISNANFSFENDVLSNKTQIGLK